MADVGPVFTYDFIEKMKEQVKRKNWTVRSF